MSEFISVLVSSLVEVALLCITAGYIPTYVLTEPKLWPMHHNQTRPMTGRILVIMRAEPVDSKASDESEL